MSAEMYEEELGGSSRSSSRKRLSGKRLVLFVVMPVLLLGGAVAGLLFSGALSPLLGTLKGPAQQEAAAPAAGAVPSFFPVPDIIVNLRSSAPRPSFLKLSVSLELDRPEQAEEIKLVLPRVIDAFQSYLRELKPEELQGSAGLYRLRQELLARINDAVAPVHVRVRDVLFKEMLVQ